MNDMKKPMAFAFKVRGFNDDARNGKLKNIH